MPLAAITYNDVASWLEALAAETTFGARADYLSYVGQVYKRAQQREHIPATTVNPFRDQQHGKKSVSSYKFIPDETLVAILALLDPKFRLRVVTLTHKLFNFPRLPFRIHHREFYLS